MTDFSKLLNPQQCAAATAGEGPMLVLAAAGTGKTRTLVHRVAYLVEKGVPPERILLLTFTNRAAREMLDRAKQVVGDSVSPIWSGTFHSICARLLRRYAGLIGYQPGFDIIDEDDQKKLVGEIIKASVTNPKDFPKKELVAKMISEAANEEKDILAIAGRWQTKAAGFEPEQIAEIAKMYKAKKFELNAMDFDDLIVKGLELLETKQAVREALQEHFLHVLVDEYQDTNGLQARLTDILAAKHRNIMAVGDDFQCIYTWRGAQIENIMDFPKRWEGCNILKLERNYRSLSGILDVANAVMKDAHGQFDKTLRPARTAAGEKPYLYSVFDSHTQASEILKEIKSAREIGYRYSDIAVLYRSHFQSIDIQMTLTRAGIPFRITSGIGIFEQIHAKDVLAYLRLLVNQRDELSFLRFAMLFPGVGEMSARKYWVKLACQFDPKRKEDRDAFGAMIGKKAQPVWNDLSKGLADVAEKLSGNRIGEIVENFLDFFYEDYLRGHWEHNEAEDRINDIHEIAVQIASDGRSLDEFLQEVALMTNLDVRRNDPNLDRVTLSTIHQAKGMEWPVVMVPWCCESMFPSAKAIEEGRLDEERRLFYVVVTRAKDLLYLFSPKMRKTSDGGVFPVEMSAFVREIPKELLNLRRADSFQAIQYNAYSRYGNSYGSGHGGGYGGGYGSDRYRQQKPAYKTTWRR